VIGPAAPALPGAEDRAGGPEAIGRLAIRALQDELELHPKPGLVSPGDRGAHRDMDEGTFRSSLRAIDGAFAGAARAGAAGAPFQVLRSLGVDAETRMLAATAGVNTHRGAIFGLGLLSAAAGRLWASGRPVQGRALGLEVSARWGATLRTDPGPGDGSHGRVVAGRHGTGGAREEAAAGFPHVFDVGLPVLEEALTRGAGRGAASVQALLALVSTLPDTNLLWRGGQDGLAFARRSARDFLDGGGVHRAGWEGAITGMHRAFTRRRLSPGGSADLLAATLLVHDLRRGSNPA
jgi:triphosphoribosyl-dephospho-CoA synthase